MAITKITAAHILNALRLATVTWHVRAEIVKRASKSVVEGTWKNGKKKVKLYYQCALCKEWHRDATALEVDHIDEVGSFTGDWNDYINRLFCSPDNLQLVCIVCHQRKTTKNARERWSRLPRE